MKLNSSLQSVIILSYFACLFSLISVTSFVQKSPTYDEPYHLFAGYSHLKWGDYRTYPEHPPLAKVWTALPLLAFDIKDPRPGRAHWELIPEVPSPSPGVNVANDMLFVDNNGESLFFLAKLQMIMLGFVLGVFIFVWAKRLYGLSAAMVALFVYGLDPNILAHTQIIHTDIPFAAFFFISIYFLWRSLENLTLPNLLLCSLFFGLTAITKYSFYTMLPVWAIFMALKIFDPEPQRLRIGRLPVVSSRWGKAGLLIGVMGCAIATAYFSVWAAYGFRFHAVAGGVHALPIGQVMPESPFLSGWASFFYYHHLFPEAWMYGQLFVLKYITRATYLLGQFSNDGFWGYFPVAIAVKTPLPTLCLLIVGLGIWISNRRERMPSLYLLVPAFVYLALAISSRMNIGLRHVLPIFPFLFVFIGGTAAMLWKDRSRIRMASLSLLGAWYVWSCVNSFPHYLAFFNELVGGPRNGHKILVDSNLDWGQDLKGLRRWMKEHAVKKIQFLYFGLVDPEYYGIDAVYLPGSGITYDPPATRTAEVTEYVAISATSLTGVYLDGESKAALTALKPRLKNLVTTIGHSIFVYRLD